MQAFIVALIFAVAALACMNSAAKGYRGVATSHREGYGEGIPDTTLTDPERRKKANKLVAYWETAAALLCLPPAAYAIYIALDPERRIPLPVLIGIAVYSIIVFSIAGYPLEKIKE
ncbi:hypothetical protein [Nocardia sp. NBC_01329]|uniref:hypothetical protein n=1 Tax=Nocardia sp. NBC_01329 TaxID=2903594 RepID=UPI002E12D1AA|nr:hypothetical protein OG405_02925 [Nocardia sp. NBC_01329]